MPDEKKLIPELMYGAEIEGIHEKGQTTLYFPVLGLVGPEHLAQKGPNI